MDLVIVESPGKIKKLREYLGGGFNVMASVGHIRDLEASPSSGLTGIDPPDFVAKYVPTARGKEVIAKLKEAVKNADNVYLATDLDREGEAIAWHLKDALKLKSYKRITFSEITKPAIEAAFKSARLINDDLVKAQEARRFIDRHVGYLVSPFLWNATGQNLSAGRVQSVAVLEVIERENAINSFVDFVMFGLKAKFDGWEASLMPVMREHTRQPLEVLAETTDALTVLECSTKRKSRNPPAPFITSTFQKAAYIQLGIKPDAAMKLAQSLYEKGLITYMRTDTPNLSASAFTECCGAAIALGFVAVREQRVWPAKDGAQEAHEAIRPTDFLMIDDKLPELSDDERSIYGLIWKAAFCSQLPAAEYSVKQILLSAGKRSDGQEYILRAVSRTLISSGWLAVQSDDPSEEKEKATSDDDVLLVDQELPDLVAGQQVAFNELAVYEIKAKPPGLHTRVSLISALERMGVGRPATYAAILTNIMDREYVQENSKNKLTGTDKGRLVVANLKGKFDFMAHEYTRAMETELDKVATGKADFKALVSKSYFDLKAAIDRAAVNAVGAHACPDCQMPLRLLAKFSVWVCSDKDNCKCRLPDVDGKPGQKIVAEVSEIPCPECGSKLIHRVKAAAGKAKGYDFWGCSNFPKCKASFDNDNGKPNFDKSK